MPVRTQSFANQTVEVIRRAILTGKLTPGKLYSVQGLFEELVDLRGL